MVSPRYAPHFANWQHLRLIAAGCRTVTLAADRVAESVFEP